MRMTGSTNRGRAGRGEVGKDGRRERGVCDSPPRPHPPPPARSPPGHYLPWRHPCPPVPPTADAHPCLPVPPTVDATPPLHSGLALQAPPPLTSAGRQYRPTALSLGDSSCVELLPPVPRPERCGRPPRWLHRSLLSPFGSFRSRATVQASCGGFGSQTRAESDRSPSDRPPSAPA